MQTVGDRRPPLGGDPRRRLLARPRRAARGDGARRPRRRGRQGRAPGGRRHASLGAAVEGGRLEHLLRLGQPQQAQRRARPARRGRPRARAHPGPARRRADRELPPRHDGAAGPRRGGAARRAPGARVVQCDRLRAGLGAPRLRPPDPGGRRPDERHRRAGPPADEGRRRARRRDRGPLRDRRHPRGAARARTQRTRPARRRVALRGAPGRARQPGVGVPRRRPRARAHGQPPPEHRSLRVLRGGRRGGRRRGRQRPAVRRPLSRARLRAARHGWPLRDQPGAGRAPRARSPRRSRRGSPSERARSSSARWRASACRAGPSTTSATRSRSRERARPRARSSRWPGRCRQGREPDRARRDARALPAPAARARRRRRGAAGVAARPSGARRSG